MTWTITQPVPEIDFKDLDLFVQGRAHDAWRRLRAEAPVAWNPGTSAWPGFWSITRYADIFAISRDPTTFSSARGISMMSDPRRPAALAGKMMLMTDPPYHGALRRLVNKGFTPRMVAQLEPPVRAITNEILDAVPPDRTFDFVTEVAAKLPLAVIGTLMGVPRADWERMFDLTNRLLGADDPEYQIAPGDRQQTTAEGMRELFGYFARRVAERRQARHEDLVGVLVEAEIDGQRLSDEEILYFCLLLLTAGNETTRNAISGGMLALFAHPEERERLRAEPGLLPTAIEEILRWTSPVLHMARVATREVELRGQRIRAGDKLLLWYPSASRDEEVFPEPDRFDVGRTPNEHLAFGVGEHFCLGANLARLELRVMFEELLERFPDLAPAGEVERLRSNFIGGIKHMPVRLTR